MVQASVTVNITIQHHPIVCHQTQLTTYMSLRVKEGNPPVIHPPTLNMRFKVGGSAMMSVNDDVNVVSAGW